MPEKERTELAVDLGRAVAEMRNHINYLLQEKITEHAPHISFEMVEILACLWKEDGVNQQQQETIPSSSSGTHLSDFCIYRQTIKYKYRCSFFLLF